MLVAFKLMHYLDHKKHGRESFMAIKLDMSKAYDRVEWDFVERVMKRLCFHEKWIEWVLKCITVVTYSVLINGKAQGKITPTIGLRQGDPLSSYLFLMCIEAFLALIVEANNSQSLIEVSIYRGCPRVTYLFFADDSQLFYPVERQEYSKLVESLKLYEAALGQKINTDKSSVTFNHNTTLKVRCEILEILGPMQDTRQGKYLGLLYVIGKLKN